METTGDLGYGIYSLTVVGMFLVATVIHICLWNKDHTFCVRCIIVTDFCLWKSIIISYQVRRSEKTISILNHCCYHIKSYFEIVKCRI